MSEEISSAQLTAAPGTNLPAWAIWPHLIQSANTPLVCVCVFLLSVGVMLLWRLFLQLEAGDSAIWDYVAQGILRGEVPYKDVIEIKGPGSAYLSAMAMWIGELAGLRDVMAVRVMQIAVVGVLTVVTFLVAEAYLRQRFVALIAAALPLTSDHFVSWAEGGTQPKLTMIMFGMLTVLLIIRDRPFWAGVCSALSCLCWQPGLLFTGVALLIFSRYLTAWRGSGALKVLAGAALPLVVTALYFFSVGALSDLWIWTIAYNFAVYAPEGVRSPGETLGHAWTVLDRVFKADIIWFVLGLVGLVLFSAGRLFRKLGSKLDIRTADIRADAMLISPFVYIAFCLVNLQSGPDLIPLFPFFSIFAAGIIKALPQLLSSTSAVTKRPAFLKSVTALPAIALLVVSGFALVRAATYRLEEWSLAYQDAQLKLVSGHLQPDDKIYVHGAAEILVLLKRRNLNPYIMWDHGKARYIADRKYGGSIDNLVLDIEAQHPKVVAVARLRHVPEGAALERWLEQHYERLDITGYDAYIRKQ